MDGGLCPNLYECEDGSDGYDAISAKLHMIPHYVGIVSAVLSVFGAAIILLAYCAFKDLRRGTAQNIIAGLALADLGAAFGSLLGIGNFLVYKYWTTESSEACWIFQNLCEIQAFASICCIISSCIWNAALAVHFLLATVLPRSRWIDRLMPLYNIVAWTLPIMILLPLLIAGKLGYTPTYQASCFVADVKWSFAVHEAPAVGTVPIICAVTTAICYTFIIISLYRKRHDAQPGRRIGKRLLAIPVIYLFLRLWDLVLFFLAVSSHFISPLACSSNNIQIAAFVTTTVQFVGYSGQGGINCFLYIFLSPHLRRRMFVLPFKKLIRQPHNVFVAGQSGNDSITSPTAPLLGITQQTQSSRARAREEGITYYSIPTEFPTD